MAPVACGGDGGTAQPGGDPHPGVGAVDDVVKLQQGHLYGVDYNNGCREDGCRQFVTLRALARNAAGTPVLTSHPYGHVRFNALNFDIAAVARAIADGLLAEPTEGAITLVGHSLGGIAARQLLYRHHDELRRAGKRIGASVAPVTRTTWSCGNAGRARAPATEPAKRSAARPRAPSGLGSPSQRAGDGEEPVAHGKDATRAVRAVGLADLLQRGPRAASMTDI